jgi:hypothetical protein
VQREELTIVAADLSPDVDCQFGMPASRMTILRPIVRTTQPFMLYRHKARDRKGAYFR